MGLIRVRAIGLGFNGGPSEKQKSVWSANPKTATLIDDKDRGLKKPGDLFTIDESKFTPEWMQEVETEINDEGKEVVKRVIERPTKAAPAPVAVAIAPEATDSEAPKRGRPKKVQA